MMSSSAVSHLFGSYKPKRSPRDLKRIYLITLSELCVTISHLMFFLWQYRTVERTLFRAEAGGIL